MTSIIRSWLTPPQFEDETKTRQAYILHYILLALLATPVVYTILTYFQEPQEISTALAQSIPSEIINILLFVLTRKGYLRIASILQVAFFWLFFALVAYSNLGVRSTAFILGSATVIVIAGILLGGKGSLVVTLFTILTGGWMAYLETSGLRFADVESDSSLRMWTITSILFLVINVVQLLSARTVRAALDHARASEAQYRSLLENIPVITYINGLEEAALTTYISPQVIELFGYTRQEFTDDPALWKKILHPEDREKVLIENRTTSESGEPFNMEYRLIAKDGHTIWVRDEAALVRSADGAPQYWLGTWTDITAQKLAEEQQADLVSAMTKRAVQLQTAAEVSRAASSTLDLEALLTTVVELIRSHFNYYYVGIFLLNEGNTYAVLKAATGEAGSQMLASHHRLEVGDSSMVGWSVAHRKPRIALDVGEDAVHFKNPHLPLTRSEIALPLISHGEIIGAMTIQSELPSAFSNADVTALQTMADQIANAIGNAQLFTERSNLIKELEARNAELERFTYTVSHDLKSPLVTIRGFLGFIHEDAKKGDMKKFENDLSKVANAADRMQDLLNDLLELSRIGRITNPPQDVPFGQIVRETVDLLAGSLKNETIKVDIQNDLPVICGDRTRLVEVVQNLLSNAIKFMGEQPEPHIEIGADGYDANGMAILFVRDNGIGIDPQYHERVFGLFNRLNPNIEGTGVGLTLVRRIVEVHGGKVWLDSKPGAGSVFYFTLPVGNPK
jgi:PAS domain S-box-containing protein